MGETELAELAAIAGVLGLILEQVHVHSRLLHGDSMGLLARYTIGVSAILLAVGVWALLVGLDRAVPAWAVFVVPAGMAAGAGAGTRFAYWWDGVVAAVQSVDPSHLPPPEGPGT